MWSALADVSRQLAKLAETPWVSVQPRKVRQALEKLLEDLRRLPARVRAYEAHDALSAQLKGRLDACAPLHEMKGAALQERHWARLLKLLRLERVPLSQLTLEHLWSADLVAQRARVADVLAVAQGEMALEEFLRGTGVREARIVPADMLRLSVESVEIAQGAIELSAANAASTPPAAPISLRVPPRALLLRPSAAVRTRQSIRAGGRVRDRSRR